MMLGLALVSDTYKELVSLLPFGFLVLVPNICMGLFVLKRFVCC